MPNPRSHQSRTGLSDAAERDDARGAATRTTNRKPVCIGPLLTFMVRRGSTVRVRQRACKIPAQGSFRSDGLALRRACGGCGAVYGAFAHAGAARFRSVMVPHHGGRTDTRRRSLVAESDRHRSGSLVYSYGSANSFGHPLRRVVSEHHTQWRARRLDTSGRGQDGLGHVHLYWSAFAADAEPHAGEGTAAWCAVSA